MEDRIDQRDGHAIAVHHGDIDSVFVDSLGNLGGRRHGPFWINQGC